MNEIDRIKLQQMPTGTLIAQFQMVDISNSLRSLEYHEAVKKELNERFAGFDAKYFEDLRQMANADYAADRRK